MNALIYGAGVDVLSPLKCSLLADLRPALVFVIDIGNAGQAARLLRMRRDPKLGAHAFVSVLDDAPPRPEAR